jgi:cyclohexyl-isocyanide hydratase
MTRENENAFITIGVILFPRMDQMDFTGPFEVFCRLPNSAIHLLAKTRAPITDAHGLILAPEMEFSACPPLDLLIIPGGAGIDALLEDEETLAFIRQKALGAKIVLTVCTGALVAGAAGLMKGRRATTHWASHHLLSSLGSIPVNSRVVVDGNIVSTAGVTAGFDGSFLVAAKLRGERTAQSIQLEIEYDPEPPFKGGSPAHASPDILKERIESAKPRIEKRAEIIRRVALHLGLR